MLGIIVKGMNKYGGKDGVDGGMIKGRKDWVSCGGFNLVVVEVWGSLVLVFWVNVVEFIGRVRVLI